MVTTGLPERLLSETVTVVHPNITGKDRYNKTSVDYATGTTEDITCMIFPKSQREDLVDRDAAIGLWTLLTNAADIDELDRVVWNSQTYDVMGPPAPFSRPYFGFHHTEVEIRLVEG